MSTARRCRSVTLRAVLALTALVAATHLYLQHPSPTGTPSAIGERDRHMGTGSVTRRDTGTTTCCPLLVPNRKASRWSISLQPWATAEHSFEGEALRFLSYIKTPQVLCDRPAGWSLPVQEGAWRICLDKKYALAQQIRARQCRIYSLGVGAEGLGLELGLARAGCEVHRFDPSTQRLHQRDAAMWHHRLSVGWRDPNPAIPARRQRGTSKRLSTILSEFGHRKLDLLKADMESAEWKILENLVLEGILEDVGQLLLEVHFHWAGFEPHPHQQATPLPSPQLLQHQQCLHTGLGQYCMEPSLKGRT